MNKKSLKYDWTLILEQVKEALSRGCEPTWTQLAKELDIPRNTLRGGLERNFGILTAHLPNVLEVFGDSDTKTIDDAGSKYKVIQSDDFLILDAKLAEIKTLDEMLEVCKVDLETWEVDKFLVNKWPGYRRKEYKNIKWKDGRIVEGEIYDEGKLTKGALFQVKIWLKRIIPLQPEIVIQPVYISMSKPINRTKRNDKTKIALVIPDIQFGFSKNIYTGELSSFHDRKALDIALQIAEFTNPDEVIYLGDLLDLADWSDKFLRSPEFYWSTQGAIIEGAWWLSQFKLVTPNAVHKLIPGNHEKRLEIAIIKHLKAAYNLKAADELDLPPALSIQKLLSLDNIGIEYLDSYPKGKVWLNNDICCIHGDIARKAPGDTVKAVIKDTDVTIVQGHNHRIELVSRVVHKQEHSKVIYGFSAGCLCKVGDGIVPGANKNMQWQQGVGIVSYTDDAHTIIPVPINNGKAIYNNTVFKYKDRLSEINKATKWEF